MDPYIQIFHTELQTSKSKVLRTFDEDKKEYEKQRTSLLAEVREVKKLVMDKDETIKDLHINVDQLQNEQMKSDGRLCRAEKEINDLR